MLDPRIQKLIDYQQENNGIDIRKLIIGTKLIVHTKNSIYHMVIKGDREVTIRGGRHFPIPTRAYLPGSTWGGSSLMMGWIGHMMCLEVHHPLTEKVLRTTGVRKAQVIAKDWSYSMDWPQDDES